MKIASSISWRSEEMETIRSGRCDHHQGAFGAMMSLHVPLLCLTLAGVLAAQAPARAIDFKGETVTIQIGFGPGGGYDAYARVLARHYGRFIPGNPIIVAKNMPGAGSLRAANYVYNL